MYKNYSDDQKIESCALCEVMREDILSNVASEKEEELFRLHYKEVHGVSV